MTPLRAWTLLFSDEHTLPRQAGTAMLGLGPTEEEPPVRWWSGEGTLTFEGLKWAGAQMADGMLLDLSAVESTPNLEEGQVTGRLAVADESLRRVLSLDLGPLHVEIGWVRSDDYGATWRRLRRFHRGRLGRTTVAGGVLEVRIESYIDDIDRGDTVVVSAGTHPDYAMMAELAQGLPFTFPLFE